MLVLEASYALKYNSLILHNCLAFLCACEKLKKDFAGFRHFSLIESHKRLFSKVAGDFSTVVGRYTIVVVVEHPQIFKCNGVI
jgi:hypothetical protein